MWIFYDSVWLSKHKIYKEIFILHTPLRSLHFHISINKNAENILGLESFFIQTALLFSYIVSIKSKSNPFPIRISYIKISNKKTVEVYSTLRNHSFHNLSGRKIRRRILVLADAKTKTKFRNCRWILVLSDAKTKTKSRNLNYKHSHTWDKSVIALGLIPKVHKSVIALSLIPKVQLVLNCTYCFEVCIGVLIYLQIYIYIYIHT